VRPLELAKKEEVDTEKYMEYLRSTFDQLLDALGYDFEEILGARTLDEIFWGGQS
jgi:DNA polymerase I